MAIVALDLDVYEYSSAADEEDPKTIFVMSPLLQFEYLKMAGTYNTLMKIVAGANDETDPEKILGFFATDEADSFKRMFEKFLSTHVKGIRNIQNPKTGNLMDLGEGEVDINLIPPMIGTELLANALSRVDVSETERKN